MTFFLLISTILLISSFNAFSLCGNDKVVFGAILTSTTLQAAYNKPEMKQAFDIGDVVQIFDIESMQSYYLRSGSLIDDMAGNYKIESQDSQGNQIDISYDGETWHSDGITGVYINPEGKKISLNGIKCSYYDLII